MRPQICILLLVVFALLLGACTPGAAPTETPTPSSGGMAPPDAGAPPAGSSDTTTGLSAPPFAPAPAGVTAPPSLPGSIARGTAVLVIGGDLPITYTGGDCDVIGEETYLTIYPGVTPGASFIIYAGTSNTRQGYLVWQRTGLPEDNAAVSNEDPLTITLNDDGFSGSFEGRAFRVGGSGEPVAVPISVSGSFTCVAQVLHVGGAHPVDLTGVSCSSGDVFTLRSGTPGSDAALLLAENGAPGSTVQAGLSWRVGGVSYTTNWLMLTIGADGVSGSYFGEATAADGTVFSVNGGFSCLG